MVFALEVSLGCHFTPIYFLLKHEHWPHPSETYCTNLLLLFLVILAGFLGALSMCCWSTFGKLFTPRKFPPTFFSQFIDKKRKIQFKIDLGWFAPSVFSFKMKSLLENIFILYWLFLVWLLSGSDNDICLMIGDKHFKKTAKTRNM